MPRLNLPITGRDFRLNSMDILMSTTDTQSHVLYVNDAFLGASGFTLDELQGSPHNIVRHPDVPPEVFQDMWATLKAGEPWSAVVKNRRKNGDHYWVRANAVPVIRNGTTTGYMSVRTAVTPEQIATTEHVFSGIKNGSVSLKKGVARAAGIKRIFTCISGLSIKWRLRFWLGLVFSGVGIEAYLSAPDAMYGVSVAGVALLAFLGVCGVLEHQITRPLEKLKKQALAVASGDHKDAITVERCDELGVTARAIGQLGLMFRWLVGDVSAQVVNVSEATDRIAQGNATLRGRTESAAASVQETAAALEQMKTSIAQTAESTRAAARLATSAKDTANSGGVAMDNVATVMTAISESSKRMDEILGTIDSIAFQTNILALNAAVEAARAGDHGRGFAVVASEVRVLAKRSADASKEVKALIGACSSEVSRGAQMVGSAQAEVSAIVEHVARVATFITEIENAAHEQQDGISQIAEAMSALDQVTHDNARLVDENNSAAQQLSYQAQRLVDAVRVFN